MPSKATLALRSLRSLKMALIPMLVLLAAPLAAQAPGKTLKIGMIDSDRIVAESARGKAALTQLKTTQDAKVAEGRRMQQELTDLKKRIDDGRLSLAPEKLDELQKQFDAKGVAFRRFQEDAEAELGKARDAALAGIEKDILGVIEQIGKEQGYTFILNKFRSGLVFADDAVDITPLVIQRFDASAAGGGAKPAGR
jgi:outer membrane protein